MDKDTVRAEIQPRLKIPAYSQRNRIIYFQPSQTDGFFFVICDVIFARAQRGRGKRCAVIESFLAAEQTE